MMNLHEFFMFTRNNEGTITQDIFVSSDGISNALTYEFTHISKFMCIDSRVEALMTPRVSVISINEFFCCILNKLTISRKYNFDRFHEYPREENIASYSVAIIEEGT